MQIGKAGNAVTSISTASKDAISMRGKDLTTELMGRPSFTEYFFLLTTGREPTENQCFFLDLLLVSIAEHGLVPTNQVARMTYAADPDFLQGAVAAGLLGCNNRGGACGACGTAAFRLQIKTCRLAHFAQVMMRDKSEREKYEQDQCNS
jgi:citrate synthase